MPMPDVSDADVFHEQTPCNRLSQKQSAKAIERALLWRRWA
jgi:hypothetical protein